MIGQQIWYFWVILGLAFFEGIRDKDVRPHLQSSCLTLSSFGAGLLEGSSLLLSRFMKRLFLLAQAVVLLKGFQYWTLFLKLLPSKITVLSLQFCQCLSEAAVGWLEVIELIIITCLMFSSQTCQCLIQCWVYSAFMYPINITKHPVMCRGQSFLVVIQFLQ